jgi:hypothetical protein
MHQTLLHRLLSSRPSPPAARHARRLPALLGLLGGSLHRLPAVQTHHHPAPHRQRGGDANARGDGLLRLPAGPDEISELAKALLIKVTEFFRDPEAFAYLQQVVRADRAPASRAASARLVGGLRLAGGLLAGAPPVPTLGGRLSDWSVRCSPPT